MARRVGASCPTPRGSVHCVCRGVVPRALARTRRAHLAACCVEVRCASGRVTIAAQVRANVFTTDPNDVRTHLICGCWIEAAKYEANADQADEKSTDAKLHQESRLWIKGCEIALMTLISIERS